MQAGTGSVREAGNRAGLQDVSMLTRRDSRKSKVQIGCERLGKSVNAGAFCEVTTW